MHITSYHFRELVRNEKSFVCHQLHNKLVLLHRTSLAIAHAKLSLRSKVRKASL